MLLKQKNKHVNEKNIKILSLNKTLKFNFKKENPKTL